MIKQGSLFYSTTPPTSLSVPTISPHLAMLHQHLCLPLHSGMELAKEAGRQAGWTATGCQFWQPPPLPRKPPPTPPPYLLCWLHPVASSLAGCSHLPLPPCCTHCTHPSVTPLPSTWARSKRKKTEKVSCWGRGGTAGEVVATDCRAAKRMEMEGQRGNWVELKHTLLSEMQSNCQPPEFWSLYMGAAMIITLRTVVNNHLFSAS